jgi:hypothetical protein
MHYVLGIENEWSARWSTDFQLFYKHSTKLIRSADDGSRYQNSGQLLSYGAEAFVRRNMTNRLYGWLSYTYSINRERDTPEDAYRPAQYDQTHIANLASNYKITGQWEAGGRLSYHTGDRYSSVNDAVYNASLDKYQPRTTEADIYAERLPDFTQLDLYFRNDVLFDLWRLEIKYGAQYISAKPQAFNVQYNYDYSEKEFFTGVPPIPYLEVKGVF